MIIVTEDDFINTYVYKVFAKYALKKYSRWFPVHGSRTLAEITGDLLTDGHLWIRIKKTGTKDYEYFAFFSQYVIELLKFSDKVNSLFGIQGKIRDVGKREFGFSLGCEFWNGALTRVMTLCGIPPNDKVKNEFDFPSWIMKCNKNIKSGFLCRAFTGDGSVGYDKNTDRWVIRFYTHKIESLYRNGLDYLNSFRKILKKDFNIHTSNIFINREGIRSKDNQKSIELCFKILKPKSIFNFSKYIGFDEKNKINKLNQALSWAENR